MITNQDGTVSFEDVTEYTQQGDSFGASDLNAMAHAINNTSSDAEHTSYDNTTSGSQSTNVQGAIDENFANMKWYVDNGWLPVRPSGDVPANMEDCSWAMLKQLASAGTLGNYYQIGDTKTIELNGGERVVMELVSINDGSGSAGAYYPRGTVDFISKDCMLTTRGYNTSNTNVGGWTQSNIRNVLNTTIYEALPQVVKDAIVEKTHKSSIGGQSTTLVEHSDKLWLPTEYELFGSGTYGATTENADVNKHYTVFSNNTSRVKRKGTNGATTYWWESTASMQSSQFECSVSPQGAGTGDGLASTSTNGVVLCFRIGQLYT
jgi:hypothetical protein